MRFFSNTLLSASQTRKATVWPSPVVVPRSDSVSRLSSRMAMSSWADFAWNRFDCSIAIEYLGSCWNRAISRLPNGGALFKICGSRRLFIFVLKLKWFVSANLLQVARVRRSQSFEWGIAGLDQVARHDQSDAFDLWACNWLIVSSLKRVT